MCPYLRKTFGLPVITEIARSHVFAKEIDHVSIAGNISIRISIVKIVCECLLPKQENRPQSWDMFNDLLNF